MRLVKLVYSLFDGPGLAFDFSELWRDVAARCEDIRKKLNIPERAVPLARDGSPASDDMRPTAIELDIRNRHSQEIEKGRQRADKKLRRAKAELDTLAIDVTDAEMKRIKAGLVTRLAEVLTSFAGRIPVLALAKVRAEAALAGFRALNGAHDVPTARSAIEWFAAMMATALAEALVNASLLKGELGYLDAAGFAFGIGGAIALIGVAAGIGWAQLRRPRRGRQIGGALLFAAALVLVGFMLIGLAHYRDALAHESANAAAAARVTMAASPFTPLGDVSLLPYMVLNVAGFALVCWKSISMWGFLDLKRHERAAAQAAGRFEVGKERARIDCDAARAQALDLLDGTLELCEAHVEEGNAIAARFQEVRDAFRCDASAIADAAIACEQEYRETVEMVSPLREPLARFAAPPPRIPIPELVPDEAETAALTALVARLVKVRDAMPGMTDEIGAAADEAIGNIGELAAQAEDQARRHPRGQDGNVLRFGKK
jgi:hypothetical protein